MPLDIEKSEPSCPPKLVISEAARVVSQMNAVRVGRSVRTSLQLQDVMRSILTDAKESWMRMLIFTLSSRKEVQITITSSPTEGLTLLRSIIDGRTLSYNHHIECAVDCITACERDPE